MNSTSNICDLCNKPCKNNKGMKIHRYHCLKSRINPYIEHIFIYHETPKKWKKDYVKRTDFGFKTSFHNDLCFSRFQNLMYL